MGDEGKVRVPAAVLAGLEAVRASGRTNMFDRRQVAALAYLDGYPEAAIWVCDHPTEYVRGVMSGFAAEEQTP